MIELRLISVDVDLKNRENKDSKFGYGKTWA